MTVGKLVIRRHLDLWKKAMNVCIVLRRICWKDVSDWVCLCNKGAIMWDGDTQRFLLRYIVFFFHSIWISPVFRLEFLHLENILSHGTEDAVVHKIVLTSLKRLG